MTAERSEDQQVAPAWRSRGFVRPLWITIVGVAAPPAILMAWTWAVGLASDPCTETWCGYGIGATIIYGIVFLAAWCVAMLGAGFLIGRTSRDSRLALRAILVALAGLALTVTVALTSLSATSISLLDAVVVALGYAIGPLIPMGLGFIVGRSARPAPTASAGGGSTQVDQQ